MVTETTAVWHTSAQRAIVVYPGTGIGRASQSHAEYPTNLTGRGKFGLVQPLLMQLAGTTFKALNYGIFSAVAVVVSVITAPRGA